jgi:hypothetical protein
MTTAWIVAGFVAWPLVALCIGVLIGKAIRNRDRQIPVTSTTLRPERDR